MGSQCSAVFSTLLLHALGRGAEVVSTVCSVYWYDWWASHAMQLVRTVDSFARSLMSSSAAALGAYEEMLRLCTLSCMSV